MLGTFPRTRPDVARRGAHRGQVESPGCSSDPSTAVAHLEIPSCLGNYQRWARVATSQGLSGSSSPNRRLLRTASSKVRQVAYRVVRLNQLHQRLRAIGTNGSSDVLDGPATILHRRLPGQRALARFPLAIFQHPRRLMLSLGFPAARRPSLRTGQRLGGRLGRPAGARRPGRVGRVSTPRRAAATWLSKLSGGDRRAT